MLWKVRRRLDLKAHHPLLSANGWMADAYSWGTLVARWKGWKVDTGQRDDVDRADKSEMAVRFSERPLSPGYKLAQNQPDSVEQ